MKHLHGRFVKGVSWVLLSAMLGGCATAPDKIKASYVSPLAYQNLSCDQLREELLRVNGRLEEAAGVQKKTANKDAAAMGVGLILFWPALFFLASGDDKKEEIARLRGESEAVESAAIRNNCPYKDEIIAAREERARLEEAAKKAAQSTQMP